MSSGNTSSHASSSGKSKGGFLRWMSMTAMVGAVLMGTARRSDAADVTVSNNLDIDNGDTSSITNLIATPGGDGISLREAITAANNTTGANSIDFSVTGTITLNSYYGALQITDSTTITGPGAATLAISGNDAARVISMQPFRDRYYTFYYY